MIVVDASIMGKWVLEDEVGIEDALLLLNNHTKGIEEIIVPELVFYEVANALATKSKISATQTSLALNKIFKLQLRIYHPNQSDIIESATLARKYKTSVYDMLYAIVAKNHKATLITADEKFINQTTFKFVKLL